MEQLDRKLNELKARSRQNNLVFDILEPIGKMPEPLAQTVVDVLISRYGRSASILGRTYSQNWPVTY